MDGEVYLVFLETSAIEQFWRDPGYVCAVLSSSLFSFSKYWPTVPYLRKLYENRKCLYQSTFFREIYKKSFVVKFCQEEIGWGLELKGLAVLFKINSSEKSIIKLYDMSFQTTFLFEWWVITEMLSLKHVKVTLI